MENKYVCIKQGQWVFNKCNCNRKTPSYNETVTCVDGYEDEGSFYFVLKGYESCVCADVTGYNSKHFRPLDEVLGEISLEEVEEVLNNDLIMA